MAVADGLPSAGLVLISYPLHPPGRPDRERTEHFPQLEVPCLFISGTRDAFGTPDELESAARAIPGPVTHHWIDGKDHALRGTERAVAGMVLAWLAELGVVVAEEDGPPRGPRASDGAAWASVDPAVPEGSAVGGE